LQSESIEQFNSDFAQIVLLDLQLPGRRWGIKPKHTKLLQLGSVLQSIVPVHTSPSVTHIGVGVGVNVGVATGGIGVDVGPGIGVLVGMGVIVGVTPGGRVGIGVAVGSGAMVGGTVH
jgi:hypothetical protein